MKTYEVWLKKTYYIGFRIEAETEEEATRIACFAMDEDECYGISNDEIEIDSVEEVNEE